MKLWIVFTVFVVVLFGHAFGGPAPDISQIKITDCNCNRCLFTQIGYAIHGSVFVKFNGGQVSCSQDAITGFGNIVVGWNYNCPISSSSGTFEVSYSYGHQICGKNYDRVSLNSCSGTPCSSFG